MIKLSPHNINGFTKIISFYTVVICVKIIKFPSPVITMIVLQNFNINIQSSIYNILSLSCWLIDKSTLTLIKEKVKIVNNSVKTKDFKTVDR